MSANVRLIDPDTGIPYRTGRNSVYTLASAATIAANSAGTQASKLNSGMYLWDVQFTGTSIVLQALGADGATWRDVATRTTSGTTEVRIGQNATVRLNNPNGTALTAVSSNLS